MKKFFQEFKEFALKSNVMALAVGIIIGGAFQGVVSSLTTNILSPILGLFAGSNFDALVLNIFGVSVLYGAFITSVIDFIIMAFVVFLMVKGMNRLLSIGKKEEPAKAPARTCPFCKTELHEKATRCPACTSQLTLDT
ncbi:MAG: large conductance mechanosensitive channel protein MscL [Clostridiales bacterium]|nr:large conductance mechanosensitive channel protein MscL [Clostridiales bacterium]